MPDELLIIAIVLLGLLLLISIFILIFTLVKKPKMGASEISQEDLKNLIEDGRIKSLKDLTKDIQEQNQQLEILKTEITNKMNEASQTNQKDLLKFLNETNLKITELQNKFINETSDVKNQNAKSVSELIQQTSKEVNELKTKIVAEINLTQKKSNDANIETQARIQKQIDTLKEQVQKSLADGFEKNDKALRTFLEQMTLVEASTEQIKELRKEIEKFNTLLSNPKTRGNFGEAILNNIFLAVFGENAASKFYKTQVNITKEFNLKQIKDEEGVKGDLIADFVFNIQTRDGVLPLIIDAKFPYTNYIPLIEEGYTKEEQNEARKKFEIDVKNQINQIKKYIIPDVTVPYAIMFIPAEAIFLDIFKQFNNITDLAEKEKIILASPSLILTIINILKFILEDYEKRNRAHETLQLISSLSTEFDRFAKRWDTHKKNIEKLRLDVKLIDTTSDKITKGFNEATNVLGHTPIQEMPQDSDIVDVEFEAIEEEEE
ncbi:MAG: DNA recombination protein RmuC [Bacilli bacterium]